jgi:hypothetical protein
MVASQAPVSAVGQACGKNVFKSLKRQELGATSVIRFRFLFCAGFSLVSLLAPTEFSGEVGEDQVSCHVTVDDRAVYAAVLRDAETWKQTINSESVDPYTTASRNKGDSENSPGLQQAAAQALLGEASAETRRDFFSKTTKSCFIGALRQRDLLRVPDSNGADGGASIKKHPVAKPIFWSGIIRFSRVGFNSGRDEALVSVDSTCGSLCGSGDLFLLRRIAGKWTIVGRANLWVS